MPPEGSDLIFDHRHNADERAMPFVRNCYYLALSAS